MTEHTEIGWISDIVFICLEARIKPVNLRTMFRPLRISRPNLALALNLNGKQLNDILSSTISHSELLCESLASESWKVSGDACMKE